MKLTLNAKAQITTTMKQVEEKVNQSVVLLKKEIDANTPEDTLKLIRNNKIIPAKIIGNTVVGSVVNDTEYALYVEYGVGGNDYNYHKRTGGSRVVFYVGYGARMFTRAFDKLKLGLLSLLEK